MTDILFKTVGMIAQHLLPCRGGRVDAGVVEVDALPVQAGAELRHVKAPDNHMSQFANLRNIECQPLRIVNGTASPGECGREGSRKVVGTPGDDHVVVVQDEHRVEQMRQADALEEGDTAGRKNSKQFQFQFLLVESMSCVHGRVLAHRALNEDACEADDEHAGEVGDEEDGAAVLVGHVGKPPHVPKAHSKPKHGEDEVETKNDQKLRR